MFNVKTEDGVSSDLSKISADIVKRVISKIYNELVASPRQAGKALTGEFKDLYSYRCCGDYRVIYRIIELEKTIMIIRIRQHSYK